MSNQFTNELFYDKIVMKDGVIDLAYMNQAYDEDQIENQKHSVQIGKLRFTQYRVKSNECKRAKAGSKVPRYAEKFKKCYPWYFNKMTM